MVPRPPEARRRRPGGRLPAGPAFRAAPRIPDPMTPSPVGRRLRALFLVAVLLVAGMAVLAGVGPTAQAQQGQIGVSPAKLAFDDPSLVRGGAKEATLHFQQRFDATAEVTIEVLPPPERDDGTARDASAWVTADPVGTFLLEPTDDYPVRVVVAVPEEAANGDYGAAVRFKVTPQDDGSEDEEGAGASVATSVTSLLEIVVGGEQVNRVESAGAPEVRDAEEDGVWTFRVPLANTGNVASNPHVRIQVWDKLQEHIIHTFWFNDTTIRPGVSGLYTFSVDTLELPRDQYWARIAVFNEDVIVSESDFQTFDVVAFGDLKRLAVLRTIRIGDGSSAYADAGDLLAVTAVVQNDGELPLVGVFKAKVYLDGKLLEAFETDPVEVAVGDEGELEYLHRVDDPGQYEFRGRVHYGPKVTEEKSALVTVRPGETGLGGVLPWLGGGVLLLVLGGIVVGVSRRSGAKPRHGKRTPGPRGAGRARRSSTDGRPAGRAASNGRRPHPRARGGAAPARPGRPPARR